MGVVYVRGRDQRGQRIPPNHTHLHDAGGGKKRKEKKKKRGGGEKREMQCVPRCQNAEKRGELRVILKYFAVLGGKKKRERDNADSPHDRSI